MQSSFEGLEISAVSKKKTQGTGPFDILHEDEDLFSDYDVCLDIKDQQLNLQEDYLQKLKIQRQRMENLSKSIHQKEQLLERETQRNGDLLCEIQRLTTFIPFKEKYEDVKQSYDELLLKHQMTQGELVDVKEQLAQVVYENSQLVSKLKSQLKSCKEASDMAISQLEECLCDKQDEIKKIKRDWIDKQDCFLDEIKCLKNTLAKLRSQMEHEEKIFQKDRDRWVYEMKMKDSSILELEKCLDNAKKHNVDLKNDVMRYSEEVNARQSELASLCNKFKNQLTQAKKSIHDKENVLEQTQNELKKTQSNTYELQGEIDDLKIQYKKTCQHYENNHKKIKYETDSEIVRLEAFVKELKESIEELMEVKNHLIVENRKLIAILKKKQQQEKQRKQILKTQLKEIDRIEKVIDKIH